MRQLGEPPQGSAQAPGSAVLRGFNERSYILGSRTVVTKRTSHNKSMFSLLTAIFREKAI